MKISDSKYGCRLGILKSNIIAYADDIVLLAPSPTSLQILINIAYAEAQKLEMKFNIEKSKCLVFNCPRNKPSENIHFCVGNKPLERVLSFKYLGFILNSNLCNSEDVNRVKNKFYQEFNSILRKFSFSYVRVKLHLFRQFCLQFYGAELWFGNKGAVTSLKQFGIGYHKAIKKVLGLSYNESSHYACQEAELYTFENLVNKIKIMYVLRLMLSPCDFLGKINSFLSVSSVLYNEVYDILQSKYNIQSLVENDKAAIMARISFVQNREPQSRGAWF